MNEEVAAKVYGLGEGEGEARWWLGGLATIKATSKETDGLYTLVEVLEPEGEAPLHVHHREDEAFWVLDGEVTFRIGDERPLQARSSSGPGMYPTPSRCTRDLPDCCSCSRPGDSRSSSTPRASRPRSAPCLPRPKVRQARRRWSSYELQLASTEASCSSREGHARWREDGRVLPPRFLREQGRTKSFRPVYSPECVEGEFCELRHEFRMNSSSLASVAALCNKARLTSPVIRKGSGVWGRPL
jgi:hypothetical protein